MLQRYMLSQICKKEQTEVILVCPAQAFRGTHLRINGLDREGLVKLNGIFIPPDAPEDQSQLLATVDAYRYSVHLLVKLHQEFYREHGLEGKTDKEIDRYLDKHELSLPEPGAIPLPTIRKGEGIKFTYQASVDFPLALVGYAQT